MSGQPCARPNRIPPDIRARMDADRAKAEAEAFGAPGSNRRRALATYLAAANNLEKAQMAVRRAEKRGCSDAELAALEAEERKALGVLHGADLPHLLDDEQRLLAFLGRDGLVRFFHPIEPSEFAAVARWLLWLEEPAQ